MGMEKYQDGCTYHIYNIGSNEEAIFFEDRNYKYLIRKMIHNYKMYGVNIIAFCFMPNHFHLLLKQESGGSISEFLDITFAAYDSSTINHDERSGDLFKTEPKIIQIKKTELLKFLIWYIHNNPMKAGMIKRIEEWKHSNYLECVGRHKAYPFDLNVINEAYGSQGEYKLFGRTTGNNIDPELKKSGYLIDNG
jgi:REP-associated tyrosine transposase